jgi:hypothetical protein
VDAAPQGGGDASAAKLEVGNTKAEVTDTGSNGTFTVTTEGTGRLSVDSSGRTLLGGVTANANGGVLQLSSGITFPATAVAATDATTLDDYEEGTWTPVVQGSTTAGTATYGGSTGRYTKIGRLVIFELDLQWSSGTGTGDLRVNGLPFTNSSSSAYPPTTVWHNNLTLTANNVLQTFIENATTYIVLDQIPVGGGARTAVAYDAAAHVAFSGFYTV